MSISTNLRDKVRKRAKYACEYCGVKEEDSGGILTIDHFIPQSKAGTDDFDNLIYSCFRCNLYKQSYSPLNTPSLWNPRLELFEIHFIENEKGLLEGLTSVGKFTIKRLKLNRLPLVQYRLKFKKSLEEKYEKDLIEKLAEILVKQNEKNVDAISTQVNLIEAINKLRETYYEKLREKK